MDYVDRIFDPDKDEECKTCIHRSPEHCPCEIVEIIPVSEEEIKQIVKNLDKGNKC